MIPNRALFVIDPGKHTGVAWGIFDINARSTGEALLNKTHAGSDTITGPELHQIKTLSRLWREFLFVCVNERCMPVDSVELVCEDFILAPGAHGGGKEGNISQRITWGLIGYREGQADEFERAMQEPARLNDVILQAPRAMTYATNERLREWGLWVRGREHERSAWKHVAYRVHKLSGRA